MGQFLLDRRKGLRCLAAAVALLAATGARAGGPPARPGSLPYSSLHPSIDFGTGLDAAVSVTNLGLVEAPVQLIPFDTQGEPLREVVLGPLLPGARAVGSKASGTWPDGTVALGFASEVPLHTTVVLF